MDTIITIVIIGIGISIIYKIWEYNDNLRKAHEAEVRRKEEAFNAQMNNFDSTLNHFFSGMCGEYGRSYQTTQDILTKTFDEMQKISQELAFETEIDYDAIVEQYARTLDGFSSFGEKVYNLPFSIMIDAGNYGKVRKGFWNYVRKLSKESIIKDVRICHHNLSSNNYDAIFSVSIKHIIGGIWFYATEKPYSAESFKNIVEIFNHLVDYNHIDVTIAELYAMKQMGGEDVLRERIRNLLHSNLEKDQLMVIASALMWMNAYQIENVVLQHMLSTGMQMTAKMQERLHSLTNGWGKAPSGLDVASYDEVMYFDVSALVWKDDEYIGLFENLAFQEKILTYSLAIRDEDKEFLLIQGINVPSEDLILHKFNSVFSEEYGNKVTVAIKKFIALSGSGEENLNGLLVRSKECSQMGILVHIVRIGKKVNIKFYTLFVPDRATVSKQKQQALSLYKKLSPSVNMWENSLKDTILLAIQQLLNSEITKSQPDSLDIGSNDVSVF